MRERVEITYVTPLEGAFTQPVASRHLGGMLDERKIAIEGDFMVDRVDPDARTLVSMDEREVPFDLLVTVPLNMGADFVARSGLGDELNYVPVDKHTLLSKAHPNIFAIGDASDIPVSKAGLGRALLGRAVREELRGACARPTHDAPLRRTRELLHRVGTRQRPDDRLQLRHRAPGRQYPVPGIGPFTLLGESHINHSSSGSAGPTGTFSARPAHARSGADVDGRQTPQARRHRPESER